jgi:acyl dehydratase
MPKTTKIEDLPALAGQTMEPSEWLEITQERVNQFADATNDHQFIHVEPLKAKLTPFGGTIAHGFLTLSLITYLMTENAPVPARLKMTINYGSDKVEKKPGQWLVKTEVTIEIENEDKPALIAEILMMHFV